MLFALGLRGGACFGETNKILKLSLDFCSTFCQEKVEKKPLKMQGPRGQTRLKHLKLLPQKKKM